MRVKIKGKKWQDPSKDPIALELTTDEKKWVAAALPSQTLFVFEDDQAAPWATEEDQTEEAPVEKKEFAEVKPKAAPKAKAKSAKGKGSK